MESVSHTIGGIALNIYNLDHISTSTNEVAVLFFLHGRFGSSQDKSTLNAITTVISHANAHQEAGKKDLVVVTLDQRNHGSRLVNMERNRAWKDNFPGFDFLSAKRAEELDNPSHASDMYAIQTGTARDISSLIDFLAGTLFPAGERTISAYYLAGVSLGGHATWLGLAHDPRIVLGVPIIGCPDYHTLLADRAANTPAPLGPLTLSPPLYPKSLHQFVQAHDPCNVPLSSFANKKILICSGALDELVPVRSGTEQFIKRLKSDGKSVVLDVFIQEGCGHRCSKEMAEKAAEFIWDHGLKPSASGSPAKM